VPRIALDDEELTALVAASAPAAAS